MAMIAARIVWNSSLRFSFFCAYLFLMLLSICLPFLSPFLDLVDAIPQDCCESTKYTDCDQSRHSIEKDSINQALTYSPP